LEEGQEIHAGRFRFRVGRLSERLFQARTVATPYSWGRHVLLLSLYVFLIVVSAVLFARWTLG